MILRTRIFMFASLLILAACADTHIEPEPTPDFALLWVAGAAEYQAATKQIYALATGDLKRLRDDPSWSAVPYVAIDGDQPTAVVLDVDQTVLDGVDMNLTMVPYSNQRQYEWGLANQVNLVRGAKEFIAAARALDIEVFFLTNRPCQPYPDAVGDCPIEQVTIDDLRGAGIQVDAEHILFANEQPGWDREKVVRRNFIARTHRVIMLLGDDLADFIACTRGSPRLPCTEPATRQSRDEALEIYGKYWGNGWYILPNPMHGSWTSVE